METNTVCLLFMCYYSDKGCMPGRHPGAPEPLCSPAKSDTMFINCSERQDGAVHDRTTSSFSASVQNTKAASLFVVRRMLAGDGIEG